ncbi:hypothetical protein [Allostreptomyces psammosilenae]|uniref:Uncharacterized protein n=1 Tax=Allostreptomyces psammosilenae TaxID=1892865 RepID=A0A853A0T9_9ACTN|nr:hypothetical protein [Allostreptomyces psammosilenae]NYI08005.1 hypothetical protein [Allostreptomyces psammosilenae]
MSQGQQPGTANAHGRPPSNGRRVLLCLYFVGQVVLLPLAWVWNLLYLVVAVLAGVFAAPGGDLSGAGMLAARPIGPAQLRRLLSRDPEVWNRHLREWLPPRLRRAEERTRERGQRVAVFHVPRHHHAGLPPVAVARLAAEHGWTTGTDGTAPAPRDVLPLRRELAPEPTAGRAHPGAPDHAAPGTPWGPHPLPSPGLRPLLLLPSLLYVPVLLVLRLVCGALYGLVEGVAGTTGGQPRRLLNALDTAGRTPSWFVAPWRVVRNSMDDPQWWRDRVTGALSRAETARGSASIRTQLDFGTYRGIGALQALRIAEERGWRPDPDVPYAVEPTHRIRLRRA